MRLGKGIFIWNIGETDGGNPAAIGARLNSAHIDWIQLKVANGTIKWKIDPAWIARLRAVWSGKIYGWTFCTGLNPSLEACNLAEQVRDLVLDGGLFDVESVFEDQPNAVANAILECDTYHGITNKPVGLCTWAYWYGPTGNPYHPVDVARAFMQLCDFAMPMEYWGSTQTSHDLIGANYLKGSLAQWRERVTDKPIVPAGRAYIGDGGYPVPAQMRNFDAACRAASLPGISWWSLQHAVSLGYPSTELVAQGAWPEEVPVGPRPPGTLEARVARLEVAVVKLGGIL